MITRAYRKNLVVISDIDSDTVETAYLFIREEAGEPEESLLLAEADRIVRECGAGKKRRGRVPSGLLWFLGGCAASGVFSAVIALLI